MTERFPSRGRRASTAFARKPVVSSARPARRDAGATKTRHRRRRRFSRRDGPASRARRERERATYLDGAERRGGGKGEGGHLRGLYVNGAFVCAAHRRRRASQHASRREHSFVSPFRELPSFRSTVERRLAIDGLILESKGGAFFRPRTRKAVRVTVIYSRKQQRTHNAFRLTGRIWPPSALLWARRCLGEETQRVFRRRDGDGERLGRAVPALPLDRPRDVLRALSNRVRQPRVDANWVFAYRAWGRRPRRARGGPACFRNRALRNRRAASPESHPRGRRVRAVVRRGRSEPGHVRHIRGR